MSRVSWHRKIWSGRSKGMSTVVGTVFLMLIIFMVSANVLLWTFSRNAEYNEAVMARNQEEANRRNEKVVASEVSYFVDGDKVRVETELRNEGSVAAQIVNLWVLDTTTQKYGFNETIESLNLNLNPGDNKTVSAVVTIPGIGQSHAFNSWFVTARGNTIPLGSEEAVMWAQLSQGLGSIVLDFHSFRYYNYSGYTLQPWPDGNIGFRIPTNLNVAFGALLTNRDPQKRTLVFHSPTSICLIHRTGGGAGSFHWARWHIVNVDNSTGTITSILEGSYTPISLTYGETELIVFASAEDIEEKGFSLQQTPKDAQLCPLSMLVFGELGSQPYSQNIPFVSISFDEA